MKTRQTNNILIVIIIVAIGAGAAIGIFALLTSDAVTANTNGCDTPYQLSSLSNVSSSANGQNGTTLTLHTHIFLMKQVGQTGRICLESQAAYLTSLFQQSATAPNVQDTTIFASSLNNTKSTNVVYANARVVSSVPYTIAVYDITISKANDSKCVYRIFPGLFCPGIPLAVGYNSTSHIAASDLSWLQGTYYCPADTNSFRIIGLSGISVQDYSMKVNNQ